jgi:hypothetical protein
MLGTSLLASLLRAGVSFGSVSLVLVMAVLLALGAALTGRWVRRSLALQLLSSAGLAVAGVPLEVMAGVSMHVVAAAALARLAVFVASVLVARGALAATAKAGRRKSQHFYALAAAISALAAVALSAKGEVPDAIGCAVATASMPVFALLRPTAKDLKPLGLALGGLILTATFAPFVP